MVNAKMVVVSFRDSGVYEGHILFWFLGWTVLIKSFIPPIDDLVCRCRYKLGNFDVSSSFLLWLLNYCHIVDFPLLPIVWELMRN